MSTVTPPDATSSSRRRAAARVANGAAPDWSSADVVVSTEPPVRGGRGPVALIAAAGVVVTVVALLAALRSTSPWAVVTAALVVVWAVSGTVAARPGGIRALGVVMVGLAAAGAAASYAAVDAATDDAAALGRAVAVALVVGVAFHLAVVLPTGSAATRRRRWLVLAGYLGVVPLAVESARRRPEVPATVAGATVVVLGGVALAAFVAACGRAGNRDRARLQWDGWGALVALAVAGGVWSCAALIGWPPRPAMVVASGTVLVPIGLVASTSEHGLARAGKVLVHTIVVVGLVALVSSIYLAVVVGLGGLPDESERAVMALSLTAAAIAALLVVPARGRLVEFANQRVYGVRTAPDTALRTFATRMSRSVPMDELLLQLVESLRQTMGLSCAEVWTGSDGTFERQVSVPRRARAQLTLGLEELEVATRTRVVGNGWLSVWLPALLEGRDDRRLRVAPIAHLGELLGFIVCERVEDAPAFDEEEDRVLADLTRQVGLALHNVRLDSALQASLDELQVRNLELQASRARIVAASDEARRRIERNLHDGAQQHLVAMAVKLGLARQLLSKDPAVADGLLEELRSDVQVTVGELRELAHGIYPPLLRDRGLAEALGAAANRSPLPAQVEAEDIGRFDTDLEAAVYFCCLEAMQNAGKHAAGATALVVTIERSPSRVAFSVHDDGAGFDVRQFIGGHGFTNMQDRLGAIGGELSVTSDPGVGTTISGWVPVAGEAAEV